MRLVYAGTPQVALPTLQALLDAPRHEVVAVVTRPDRPAGRGRAISVGPVKELALAAGVEVLAPDHLRDPAFLDRLSELAPDCCPVVAYGAIVPPAALAIPRHGWVNLHFSLLPAWRGAAPVQHAILAGDEVTGATTFRLEEGLDTGPIYGVVTTEVGQRETAGDVLQRLAAVGAGLMLATLDGLADGSLAARPQPAEGVSFAPKIGAEDARIDWSAPALRVDRLLRACTPTPGAWTTFRDRRIKLGPVTVRAESTLAPGDMRVDPDAVVVGTGSTDVQLGDVRPEGRRPMPAPDWARGLRLTPGDRLH